MKFMKKLMTLLVVIIVATSVITVNAETYDFENLYMSIEVPEGVVVITTDTDPADAAWGEAGITDVSKELKEINKMNVQAIFYDKESKTSVKLLVKESDETKRVFNFLSMSEEELTTYFNKLMTSKDDSVKVSINKYDHIQTPFYSIKIESMDSSKPFVEVIYGTIMNGKTISFDVFIESNDVINEEFVHTLVDNVNFTNILEAPIADESMPKLTVQDVLVQILILGLLVVLILVYKRRKKKVIVDKKEISSKLQNYRLKQVQNDKDGIKQSTILHFMNSTEYKVDGIKEFCIYNRFIKNSISWGVTIGSYLLLLYISFSNSTQTIYIIIMLVLGFWFAYNQMVAVEKQKESMIKKYMSNKSKVSITKFYDDNFTVSGIFNISDYPYFQITEAREHKEFIYLYFGTENAVIINKNCFDQGTEENFRIFIKEKLGDNCKFK